MSDFWVGKTSAPDTYRLVSMLGGGGEGEVWKAVLTLSAGGRREVAIKITRARDGDDEGEQWEQFGHLLRSLSHPGLVRVTDVFLGPPMHRHGDASSTEAPLLRYAVMDYIDGINLREWAGEHPEANASQRLRLLGMVAAALDEMHSGARTEIPVAHGDVKPANIVVRDDGAAILVDLGLARLTDGAGVPGRSAAYAAPELRTKGALATPEADRYAFAVTTAQLLTGQAPPVGDDGWLDPAALRAMLAANPLTARRHTLVDRIMTMISSPAAARTTRLRPWLDGAVESLSQVTSTSLPAIEAPGAATEGGDTVAASASTSGDHLKSPAADEGKDMAAGEPTVEPAGERFGPYLLEQLIGRGGMGEVYRATDTRRKRVVALKRLPAALADDPEYQARFREESALAARLNEPHIIPIHDFGEIDGRLYIDMRLVEGTDLAQLIATHGALAPARAVHVVRQIAAALDAAHAAGLAHRDVKPANVLLRTSTETGTDTDLDDGHDFAYLVDFGIARAADSTGLTGTGGAIGSVLYMAPERFHGHSDPRSDIYSLGCLLFEALTGRRPFPAEEAAAAIHAHLYTEPPRASETNPAAPAALDSVIATAMAKDPDQRYASAGAFAAAARNAQAFAEGVTVLDAANAHTSHIPPTAGAPGGYEGANAPVRPPYGGPYPPGVPHPLYSPTPPPAKKRDLQLVGLVATSVLLVAALVGGFLALRPSTDPEPTLTATSAGQQPSVIQEPIETPGANPYMPAAGNDVAGVEQPPEARGAYAGSTPGLYGGTLNNAECDRPTMISFLQTHPDKAAAWAAVQNINPQDIPAYINQLTPLVVRSDTAVTNHGFADGKATTLQSVLQAGSAVLVDAFGVPRARCACGNPLLAPEPQADSQYAQPAWPQFNPSNVVTVQPSPAPITEFPVIDVNSGNPFLRPAGTAGDHDQAARVQPPPTRATAQHPVPVPPPAVKDTPEPTVTPKPRPCPKGERLIDGECRKEEKTPTCDPPGKLVDGKCQHVIIDCKYGPPVNGKCPPKPDDESKCPPGYSEDHDHVCVKNEGEETGGDG